MLNRSQSGFSLVEVCLALLVVGLGLLAIFGLFPGGLRSSEGAAGDTTASLFAENVLCGIEANASVITSWDEWRDAGTFRSKVLPAGFYPTVTLTGLGSTWNTLNFPQGSENWLRYRLDVATPASPKAPRLAAVTLQVVSGHYGALTNWDTFCTQVAFQGM